MALDYKFDIRLAVENALYEHTTDDMGLKEIEEIRGIINKTIDDFIKENNIKQQQNLSFKSFWKE